MDDTKTILNRLRVLENRLRYLQESVDKLLSMFGADDEDEDLEPAPVE